MGFGDLLSFGPFLGMSILSELNKILFRSSTINNVDTLLILSREFGGHSMVWNLHGVLYASSSWTCKNYYKNEKQFEPWFCLIVHLISRITILLLCLDLFHFVITAKLTSYPRGESHYFIYILFYVYYTNNFVFLN